MAEDSIRICSAASSATLGMHCLRHMQKTLTVKYFSSKRFVQHKTDVADLGPMFHLYVWVIRSIGNDHNHIRRVAVWCWAQTGRRGKKGFTSQIRGQIVKALNRWGYYPRILIGAWLFGTINRIHDFIDPGHKIFWLSVLDFGTAALVGLFNSVAYGLNSSVRRA